MTDPPSQAPVDEYPDPAGAPGQRQDSSAWPLWGIIATVVAVTLCIVGLMIVFGVFGDTDVSGTAPSDDEPSMLGPTPKPAPQEVEQEPAHLNEAAVDGNFTFVVTAVQDDPVIIAGADLGIEPEGKFVFVTMTATNHSDSPRSLPEESQYLIDIDGRKASADTDAAANLPENAQSLFREIEPGNTATGIVVFDIPADATPAGLELHYTASSGGVAVVL